MTVEQTQPTNGSVVAFEAVTLTGEGAREGSTIWGADLAVGEGEVALVNLGVGRSVPLADACAGLHEPVKGTIRYRGNEWASLPPDGAAKLRGTIGRVFFDGGWVSGMSAAENIMLGQLHHTSRSRAEIRSEAQRLARHFGLPGLPGADAEEMSPSDRQRAACARAFMGEPALIVLENPTRGVYPGIMGPLMRVIGEARQRGAAVLWLTTEPAIWNERSITWSQRHQVAGSQLVRVEC